MSVCRDSPQPRSTHPAPAQELLTVGRPALLSLGCPPSHHPAEGNARGGSTPAPASYRCISLIMCTLYTHMQKLTDLPVHSRKPTYSSCLPQGTHRRSLHRHALPSTRAYACSRYTQGHTATQQCQARALWGSSLPQDPSGGDPSAGPARPQLREAQEPGSDSPSKPLPPVSPGPQGSQLPSKVCGTALV